MADYKMKEYNFIKEHYPSKGAKWVAENMGGNRSRGAIQQTAKRMKLEYIGPPLGTFPKGHETWNKGLKDWYEGSTSSRFKKGEEPPTARPMYEPYTRSDHGTDRLYIRTSKVITAYSRYVWEQSNGPIPSGCIIRHKDGNPMNSELRNLDCLTRSEHAKRMPANDRSASARKAQRTKVRKMRERLGLPIRTEY